MVSDRKLANVVGGKSARPCDNCIKKRARWYCAADDAFLCQSCDSSVHSANTLARRHERVLLNTASTKSFNGQSKPTLHASTTWHKSFTTKARTPRHNNKKNKNVSRLDSDHHEEPLFGNTNVLDDGHSNVNHSSSHIHLVPEICSEEASHEENDDRVQLLYRVPIFEPFVSQLCESNEPVDSIQGTFCENGDQIVSNDHSFEGDEEMMMGHHLRGFLPSESDLAEFGADVESLLGKGLKDESFDMKDLGLLDSKDCEGFVKVEEDDEAAYNNIILVNDTTLGREASFELNFDYDSPIATTANNEEAEQEEKERILGPVLMSQNDSINMNLGDMIDDNKGFDSKKMMLRLDYEGVMSAWDDKKSPWTTGERPNFNSGECYRPDCMGTCGSLTHMYGDIGMMVGHVASMADVIGREARVSRYREKRRTRLFSKKIRYEVRKLNAEKRPRMKGRFVKRSNLLSLGIN